VHLHCALCSNQEETYQTIKKKVSKWAKRNLMTFGINKCATMVIRPKNSTDHHTDPVFKINNVPIPQTDCYTHLGIPFDNKLSLKPIISLLRQKIRKAIFANKGFFKNSDISLFFKKILFNSALIGRISYYAPLLGSNKFRSKSIQNLINIVFYWIVGFNKTNSLISLYSISKEFNILPFSAKCAIVQVRCYNKWKDSLCIIGDLVNDIPKMQYYYSWAKESRTFEGKLTGKKLKNDEDIKNFYWENDLLKNSSKAKIY